MFKFNGERSEKSTGLKLNLSISMFETFFHFTIIHFYMILGFTTWKDYWNYFRFHEFS